MGVAVIRRPHTPDVADSHADNVIALHWAPDGDLPHVPAGEYNAVHVRHFGKVVFRVPKVCVLFRLVEHPDIILPRWYCVSQCRGRIRTGPHSDLVRELSAILGRRVRADRIPLELFERIFVTVEVRDVVEDRKQNRVDPVNRYSVIGRIVARAL
jgi:hypothetical protein